MPIAGIGRTGKRRGHPPPACETGKTNAPRNPAGGRPAFWTLHPGRRRRAGRRRHRSGRCALPARQAPHHARVVAYTPPYAAIVVDANSGHVLHATNADALRHPASLTKIMTLYLLFEQIEAGKLRLDFAARGFRARLAAGTLEARAAAGPDHLGRGRDPRAGHQVGQRRRGGRRRSDRRRRRDLRPHDDAQGARARHEPHGLRQCVRPARSGPAHHRARSGDARPRHPGPLPALLPLFRDAELRLSRPRDAQSQQAARPRAGRRRHQDRLHARLAASTSSPRCGAATATSWRWCSAAPRARRAMRACAC